VATTRAVFGPDPPVPGPRQVRERSRVRGPNCRASAPGRPAKSGRTLSGALRVRFLRRSHRRWRAPLARRFDQDGDRAVRGRVAKGFDEQV